VAAVRAPRAARRDRLAVQRPTARPRGAASTA
jgi:hypothetical protein